MANLFTEDFTGSDGAGWNGTRWTGGSGTCDINSNRGRMVTTSDNYAFCQKFAQYASAADAGDIDIRFKYTVTNATNQNYARIFARDGGSGNRMNLTLDIQSDTVTLYTETGYGGPDIDTAAFAFATNDVIHGRWLMVGDQHTVWLGVGSLPGSPTLEATESTWQNQTDLSFFTGTGGDGVAITGYWDDITVDDPEAPGVILLPYWGISAQAV